MRSPPPFKREGIRGCVLTFILCLHGLSDAAVGEFPERAADGGTCEPAEGDAAESRGGVDVDGFDAKDEVGRVRFDRGLRAWVGGSVQFIIIRPRWRVTRTDKVACACTEPEGGGGDTGYESVEPLGAPESEVRRPVELLLGARGSEPARGVAARTRSGLSAHRSCECGCKSRRHPARHLLR